MYLRLSLLMQYYCSSCDTQEHSLLPNYAPRLFTKYVYFVANYFDLQFDLVNCWQNCPLNQIINDKFPARSMLEQFLLRKMLLKLSSLCMWCTVWMGKALIFAQFSNQSNDKFAWFSVVSQWKKLPFLLSDSTRQPKTMANGTYP